MRPQPTLAACFAASLFVASAASAASAVHRAAQPVGGAYLVVLKSAGVRPAHEPNDRRPSVADMANEMAANHRIEVGFHYGHALAGFAFRGDAATAEQLANDPRVAYVAEDGWVEVASAQVAPPSWGLDRVDQRPIDLDARYDFYASGSGVDLYIVDSGLRGTHVDFAGRVGAGFSAVDDGYGTSDCLGHGTHVAGLAAGATYGVAKAATLHPVRVLDCAGRGTVSQIVAGIDWITARYPPAKKGATKPPTKAVANLSFVTNWTQAIDDAVSKSIGAGVTYVVAAGNGAGDACIVSPARVASAITVGASDRYDARAAYSNLGACVDLFAPGDAVVSSFHTSDTDLLAMSGTSMAAPHVAGTAALALSVNPNLTPAQVATLLKGAATAGALANEGAGSPDLLLFAPFTGTGIDMKPIADFTATCVSGTCSFKAGSSADDRGIVSYAWNGGGKSASGVAPSLKFARTVSSVTMTLKVTDTIGQTTTLQKTVLTGN